MNGGCFCVRCVRIAISYWLLPCLKLGRASHDFSCVFVSIGVNLYFRCALMFKQIARASRDLSFVVVLV